MNQKTILLLLGAFAVIYLIQQQKAACYPASFVGPLPEGGVRCQT